MRKIIFILIGLLTFNIYSQDTFDEYLEWKKEAEKGYDTIINVYPSTYRIGKYSDKIIDDRIRKEEAFKIGLGYFLREILEIGFKVSLSEKKWTEFMEKMQDITYMDGYRVKPELKNLFYKELYLEGPFRELDKEDVSHINEIFKGLTNLTINMRHEESQFDSTDNVSTQKISLIYIEKGKPVLSVEVTAPVQNLTNYIIKTYR
ncbi:hypothetical protein [Capnocytophaga granulosa]|uniref:hypothetical protein n=1 Tax=Capnocytophaga granulosa TaxID=45242 RepID=UPI0023F48CA8|nr:hypothetical protein [Capnocytophaga granulosa]